jgi:phosphohistidine phosphatase SixA
MELYLVRHAEAAPGEPDELRELTPEGREAARALGERLAAEGARVDAVLTSPLLRARQTGEAIAAALGCSSEPTDELAFGATAENVRRAVAGRGETIVAVGHQPDCGRIVAEIAGGEEPPFPPGGVVRLDVDG